MQEVIIRDPTASIKLVLWESLVDSLKVNKKIPTTES